MRERFIHRLITNAMLCFLSLPSFTLSLQAQRNVHASLIGQEQRKAAPAFQLSGTNQKTVRLSTFQGQVVLLNFWATTCGGCLLEIPDLVQIQKDNQKNHFSAIGVSADRVYGGTKTEQKALSLVKSFLSGNKLNYPVVIGNERVINSYEFRSYPATYLIDKHGRIAASYVGIISKENVEANVALLLKEQ